MKQQQRRPQTFLVDVSRPTHCHEPAHRPLAHLLRNFHSLAATFKQAAAQLGELWQQLFLLKVEIFGGGRGGTVLGGGIGTSVILGREVRDFLGMAIGVHI